MQADGKRVESLACSLKRPRPAAGCRAPLPAGYDGAAVVIEQLHRAFPDFRFEGTELPYASFDRRKAIVPWRFTGTMTGPLDPPGFAATGTRVQFEGDDHWEFRGDLGALPTKAGVTQDGLAYCPSWSLTRPR